MSEKPLLVDGDNNTPDQNAGCSQQEEILLLHSSSRPRNTNKGKQKTGSCKKAEKSWGSWR